MIIAGVVTVLASLWAGLAWGRMRIFERRNDRAISHELALMDELSGVRYECAQLFWELGEAEW